MFMRADLPVCHHVPGFELIQPLNSPNTLNIPERLKRVLVHVHLPWSSLHWL